MTSCYITMICYVIMIRVSNYVTETMFCYYDIMFCYYDSMFCHYDIMLCYYDILLRCYDIRVLG